MDRVQRNGGMAGIVAAVLLALLLIIILSLGQDAMAVGDPARSLGAITQKWSMWMFGNIVGLLVVGFAVVFVTGLAMRLREPAPTRSRAVLYLALVGLAGYGGASVVSWLGGAQVVAAAARDQTAATHAWLALTAFTGGLDGLGSAFTGAATLVAGWAIISTGAMASSLGWLGVVAGAVNILFLFGPTQPLLFFGSFILTIVWLGWAGSALRAGPAK